MSKYEWDLGEIKIAVKESINFTEVLDKIGVPRQGNNSKTLKNILDASDSISFYKKYIDKYKKNMDRVV